MVKNNPIGLVIVVGIVGLVAGYAITNFHADDLIEEKVERLSLVLYSIMLILITGGVAFGMATIL